MSNFLIEKRGLYYRPESAGYTGLKNEAGRYSFDEAAVMVGPNGPDGEQDFGLCMWAENDAPEFSTACPWDVKMKHRAYTEGYKAGYRHHKTDVLAAAKRIKIKPLVWGHQFGRTSGELVAETYGGTLYSICKRGLVFEVALRASHRIKGIEKRAESLEAAKAAAQAHHDKWVLDMLDLEAMNAGEGE